MAVNSDGYSKSLICTRCGRQIDTDYYKFCGDTLCTHCADVLRLDTDYVEFKEPMGASILLVITYVLYGIFVFVCLATLITSFPDGITVSFIPYPLSTGTSIIFTIIAIAIATLVCAVQVMLIKFFINTAKTTFYTRLIFNRLNKVFRIEHYR